MVVERYSAWAAVAPAWQHTRALLWEDGRSWRRLFKVALVALGAELGTFSVQVNLPTGRGVPPGAFAILLPLLMVFLIVGLAIWLVTFYAGSRLQLVLFDIVLLRDDHVGPPWRRHGSKTWRWMGAKAAVAMGATLLMSPLVVPVSLAMVAAIRHHPMVDGTLPSFSHIRLLLLNGLVLFLALILIFTAMRVFRALALPALALEDLRFGAIFRRLGEMLRQEPGDVLLFAFLQPVVTFAAGLAAALLELAILVVSALPLGLIGFLLWRALRHGGVGGWVLLGLYVAVAALVEFAVIVLTYLPVAGFLLTFFQAWPLYFLAGRYSLLGQVLRVPGMPPPAGSIVDEAL